MSDLEFTHRRKNQLTGDWVLVSPHRNNRPWQGATEISANVQLPKYDSKCPLCPSNVRANEEVNPEYKFTHIFTNDFGALVPDTKDLTTVKKSSDSELFDVESATGVAKVVCFSPDHNKTLPLLTSLEILKVIETWCENYIELSEQYNCIHIFENKGEIMGCSQPHPHGQIWAHDHWSTEIQKEDTCQKQYFDKHKRPMLADYIEREQNQYTRIVYENSHWIVVVPFWAAWPFETMLIAKDDIRGIGQLNTAQQASLANAIKELTTRYDNLFNCSFPYSMGWHNAPKNLKDNSHWRLHAHFYPPLLRSSTVKKHMVGYEMLAESQRDITAELAAKTLRSVPSTHYLLNS